MPRKSPPTPEQLARYASQFNQSQTLKNFGVTISFPEAHHVLATLDPIRPEQLGGLGADAVNGGVLAALFDLVIGCSPALIDPTRRSATVELSMHFMRAVRGKRLTATAKIDRAGDVLLFASASIFDEGGAECATGHGIARLTDVPWASGESPAIN